MKNVYKQQIDELQNAEISSIKINNTKIESYRKKKHNPLNGHKNVNDLNRNYIQTCQFFFRKSHEKYVSKYVYIVQFRGISTRKYLYISNI